MSSRIYISGIAFAAVLGWTAFAIVIWRLNPFISTAFAIPFFFASLFVALTSTLTLIGFYGRVWFRRGEIYFQHINISFRQAILISLAVCIALAFQILRILTWWDGFLIAAAVGLIEIYFSSRD